MVPGVVALRLATSGTNDVTALPDDFTAIAHTAPAMVKPATAPGINWVCGNLAYEPTFYLVLGTQRRTPPADRIRRTSMRSGRNLSAARLLTIPAQRPRRRCSSSTLVVRFSTSS
jgi:hypothetical protein